MSTVENFKDCDLVEMLVGRDTRVLFMDNFGKVIDAGYVVGQTMSDIIFSDIFWARTNFRQMGLGFHI